MGGKMLEAAMLAFLSKGKVEQKVEPFPTRKPRLLKIEYGMPHTEVKGADLTQKLLQLHRDSLHLFYFLENVKKERGERAYQLFKENLTPGMTEYSTFNKNTTTAYVNIILKLANKFKGYCTFGVCFRDFREDITPGLKEWGWEDEFNPLFREKGRLGVIFRGKRYLTAFSSADKVRVTVWDVDEDGEADILLLVGKRALSGVPYAELYMVNGSRIIKRGYNLTNVEDMVSMVGKRNHGWQDVVLKVEKYDNNVFIVEVYSYNLYSKELIDMLIGALSKDPAEEAAGE